MHQLSLLCPLMGKKPNLGTADAGAAVAWSDTDVAGRLYHDWPLNLQSACLCCVCSCLATVSCELDLHDELSNESLLRAWRVDYTLLQVHLEHIVVLPDMPKLWNTCFGMRLSGMHITWPAHHSCALSKDELDTCVTTDTMYICIANSDVPLSSSNLAASSKDRIGPACCLSISKASRSYNHSTV